MGELDQIKDMEMKNKTILLAVFALMAVSCYDDYVSDYSKVACGFANQVDVRSLIVGEGMSFSTGVALGGTIDNDKDRRISIGVDYSLVNEDNYNALKNSTLSYISNLMAGVPAIGALSGGMYEIETEAGDPGTALIRKGSHLGKIRIVVDSARFLSDAGRLLPKEVIPLSIIDGNGTEVIEGKEHTVIALRYENMLFGNWYHGGVAEIRDAGGNLVDTEVYSIAIPQEDNKVWTLTTTGPFELTANGVGSEFSGSKAQMTLSLGTDDSITVSSVAGADYAVQPDGESKYIRSKLLQDRMIVLSYKYADGANTVHARDTLRFRNRIRDGVNEWQDENSSHYE